MANVLSMDKKVAVISALVEGCSVRSTSRLTGVAKGTILRLLAKVGQACSDYQPQPKGEPGGGVKASQTKRSEEEP